MDQQALVVELLETFYPDECDIAGPANVRRLASGTRESIRVDGASSLDMGQVLAELQSVVIILYGTISILQTLKRSSPEPVTTEVAIRAVGSSFPALAQLDPRQREELIRRLTEWLNRDPDARASSFEDLPNDFGGSGGR